MSDKNLNTENKNAKPSLLSRIKSEYFLKFMFNHLAKAKPIAISKCNQGLKKICSDEMQKDSVNKLKNPSTWDLFLPYIYSVFSEIANEIYNNKYPNDNDEKILKRYINDKDIKQSKENLPKLSEDVQKLLEPYIKDEFIISQSKRIKIDVVEGITFLLIAEAVHLVSNNRLFNKDQLEKQNKFKKGYVITAIHDHVREIFKSLLEDSTEGSLQDTINKYLDATEKDSWKINSYGSYTISQKTIDIVEQYISNNLQHDNTDKQLIKKFSFVVLKIMCLSNYNVKNEICKVSVTLYNLENEAWKDVSSLPAVAQSLSFYINYQEFCDDLDNHGHLSSFVFGEGAYRIFNIKRLPAFSITYELPFIIETNLKTKEERDKFQKFCDGVYNSKEEVKKDEPKPQQEEPESNCEKEDLKNI